MVTIQDLYLLLIPLTYIFNGTQYIIALLTFLFIFSNKYISRENFKLIILISSYCIFYIFYFLFFNTPDIDNINSRIIPGIIRIILFYYLFINLVDVNSIKLINTIKKFTLIYSIIYIPALIIFNDKGLYFLSKNQLWFDESNLLQLYWTPPLLVVSFLSLKKRLTNNIKLISTSLIFSIIFSFSTVYLCQVVLFIIFFFNELRNKFASFVAGNLAKFSIKNGLMIIFPLIISLFLLSPIQDKISREIFTTSVRTAAIVDLYDEFNKNPFLGYGFGLSDNLVKTNIEIGNIERRILNINPDLRIKIMSSPIEMIYEGGIISSIIFIILIFEKLRKNIKITMDQIKMIIILFLPSLTVPSYYYTPMFVFTTVTILKSNQYEMRNKIL